MKILYSYIMLPGEGSSIHIESFVKACRQLGEPVIENAMHREPYAGGKENWSRARRLAARVSWVADNVKYLIRTLGSALQNRPDVLLFRFDPMHRFALAIATLSFGWPVALEVNGVRSIEYHHGRPRVSDILDRFSLTRAQRCFVVSERLREHITAHYGIDAQKIAVIENGVDVEKFRPDTSPEPLHGAPGISGRYVVGFVGSFRPWHGIHHLLDMAVMVVRELPEAVFLLVGDGPDRPQYEQRARELGLTGNVIFTGHVLHGEVPNYLAAMDVVLAPVAKAGYAGGFHGSALKIFEYMAMAKPVIAPPVGQIREVIEDKVSGLLIESEDTQALACAVLALHRDTTRREALGRRARERVVERYTWKVNAEKVRALCAEACRD